MSAADNKRTMQRIFEGLARGDSQAFRESLAEDFVWTLPGTSSWSGTWRGRAVFDDLFVPLYRQWADTYLNTAENIVAEDDFVVVECRGDVTTKAGKPYNNTYCWVCRFDAQGRLAQVTEYCDTALIDAVLEPPPARAA